MCLSPLPFLNPWIYSCLYVDASEKDTGGVLLQPEKPFTPAIRMTVSQPTIDGAYLHPVAYSSHKLSSTQQKYSSQEREAPSATVTTFSIRRFDPVHDNSSSDTYLRILDIKRLTWIDLEAIGEYHTINKPKDFLTINF
ncbi:hypothetical protein EPUL_005124 [Erysiphe pulchra]|uniref:Reverse transcriptase RNase H-like domain-containing protein n=1 Tax=Erysiphe pulchra TaxID=225359 RepID=A0A2S4PQ25_9PEZI|nr:hypothetical protein EPUL_005124 [Erysiphe pulchra]